MISPEIGEFTAAGVSRGTSVTVSGEQSDPTGQYIWVAAKDEEESGHVQVPLDQARKMAAAIITLCDAREALHAAQQAAHGG